MEKHDALVEQVQDVLGLDREKIKNILKEQKGKDSAKDCLEILLKVTTYYRDLIPRYKYASQLINARNKLLLLKEKHLMEDLQNLGNEQKNIEDTSARLDKKLSQIKQEQYRIFSRAIDLSETVCKLEEKEVIKIQKQMCTKLDNLKDKVEVIKFKMDKLKEKEKVGNICNIQPWHSEKSYELNAGQLEIIRKHCSIMGKEVNELVDKVFAMNDELVT